MEGHPQVPTFAVLPPPQQQQQQQQPYSQHPQHTQHPAQGPSPLLMTQPPSTTHLVTPPTSGNIPQHKYSSTAWNLARKAHLDNQMLITKTNDVETEDGRISNREAAEKIKDAWMYKQIRARRDEFTHYRQVGNYVCSIALRSVFL